MIVHSYPNAGFTAAEHVNFIAAKAIAHATAYLDGRNDAVQLGRNADQVQCELLGTMPEPEANRIVDPVRMLLVAMSRASLAEGDDRQDRWQQVMGALVELVRHESTELRRSGAQRS